MKYIRISAIVLFFVIIMIPMIKFNFEEDAKSLIDNRTLTANPFSQQSLGEGDLTNNIENYVNDRIGFREDFILAYTVLNDKIFNKMVHPSYSYGKDGYVFGAGLWVDNGQPSQDYIITFANMVKEIQDYCDAREIPFLFVFNPAKPAVLQEYIPTGLNYSRAWVDRFLAELDERSIRYIDNTKLLQQKIDAGEMVFNKKYDAGHWNALGAYYGSNAILTKLKEYIPTVHVIEEDELIVGESLKTSLLVSQFPINEMVPEITVDMKFNDDLTAVYEDELYRHPSYRGFGYRVSEEEINADGPRALVFQGSYMNSYGYQYLANGFKEYINVHDYQNVIDFPYYFNIFQPDCVVFEVAEYTFLDGYFDYDNMVSMNLNPLLKNVEAEKSIEPEYVDNVEVQVGEALTKIQWNTTESGQYAWCIMDKEYDMKVSATGYEVTILTETYNEYKDNIEFILLKDNELVTYVYEGEE